jgi:ABC-type glycerol-3-phosphate transport system substrate-binding protein
MKTSLVLAAIPAALVLTACGGTVPAADAPAETAEVAADDDNDTAEPVAAPAAAADEAPHDESVPHDH